MPLPSYIPVLLDALTAAKSRVPVVRDFPPLESGQGGVLKACL